MNNKTALVVGMARSGVAVAQLLLKLGYRVRINDRKTLDKLGDQLDCLKNANVEFRLGENADELLDGMDMLMISPGIPIDHAVVKAAKEKGIEVTGELEFASRVSKGELLAITGTNGKTTTTMLTGAICRAAGKTTYVVGNIGDPFSEIAYEAREEDAVVCEVSSFQMETARDFHPHVSAILNISEDHLNRHRTMEVYIAEKAKIFRKQGENDALVLNYDDEVLRDLSKTAPCKVVWFSRRVDVPFGAFLRDGQIVFGTPESFRVIAPVASLRIPGKHNVENALAAVAIAVSAGIADDVIRETLAVFESVEHRIEFVRELDGVRYINDSKGTNVDSTIKAIDTMDRPTVIILGGSVKNVSMDPLVEAIRGSNIKHAVLIGQTAQEMQAAFDKAGMAMYTHAGYDFEKAINMCREMASEGWNVLLSPACASFDMFEDYEQRGRIFKEIVQKMR